MRSFRQALLILGGASLLAAEEAPAGKGWTQWLGPMRSGHSSEPSGQWPPRKLWEKSFGESDSSPILVDGKIYLTTLDGGRTKVSCVDAATGEVVWEGHSPGGRYGRHSKGDKGFYVGPLSTPACDGSWVFTLSVDGDLWCRDAATGKKQWSLNLYDRYKMGQRRHIRDYGYTGSPMLLGSDVWLEVGGTEGAVMAFDRRTGKATATWGEGQVGHSGGPTKADARVFFGIDMLWVEGREIPWPTQYASSVRHRLCLWQDFPPDAYDRGLFGSVAGRCDPFHNSFPARAYTAPRRSASETRSANRRHFGFFADSSTARSSSSLAQPIIQKRIRSIMRLVGSLPLCLESNSAAISAQ